MLPSDYPLEVYRGDTARWQFVFWADAAKTEPVDLTEVEVAAQIRREGDGPVVATIACTVTLPNVIDAVLTALESQQLTTAPSIWDLQWTYSNGEVRTPVGGRVEVTLDATQ